MAHEAASRGESTEVHSGINLFFYFQSSLEFKERRERFWQTSGSASSKNKKQVNFGGVPSFFFKKFKR